MCVCVRVHRPTSTVILMYLYQLLKRSCIIKIIYTTRIYIY